MDTQLLTRIERPPRLTVGIPTRNEENTIAVVLSDLAAALRREPSQLMVLDDSDDDTPAQVQSAVFTERIGGHQVALLHRERDERKGGLASEVLLGLEIAGQQDGMKYFALMDGDGQHDPKAITDMLVKIEETGADIVIASRYIEGGRATGLSPVREVVSRAVTLLTRAIFPKRLAGVTDVASGMFMVRLKSVDTRPVYADGFKILLSLLVTHDWSKAEVAYVFRDRIAGESKAGAAEGLKFLRLVGALRLRSWRERSRQATERLFKESMSIKSLF
ncbi:MAG TPA: glycosyltransferase [Candidatus Saccharimonadia bacterium]|jgi:dolichol-phosphate mannosyltransferase